MTTSRLRHHGDVDAEPGLLDFAVNVRGDGPPPWLRDRLVEQRFQAEMEFGSRDLLSAVSEVAALMPGKLLKFAGYVSIGHEAAAKCQIILARALSSNQS